MSSANSSRLRRLNGRLQACDPCRRRKVACDHGQPVCQRCKRKQWDARCTYTISQRSAVPFNRHASQGAVSQPPAQTSAQSPPPSEGQPRPSGVVVEGEGDHTIEAQTPASTPGTSTLTPNWKAPGYLGYASYTTVLDEARESLPTASADPATRDGVEPEQAKPGPRITEPVMSACIAVLRRIPLAEDSTILDKDYLVLFQWVHRIAQSILEALYDPKAFGMYVGKRRDDDGLRKMAQVICANTVKPVDDSLEAKEWVAQFTGNNIRWESIGLLFTFWDTARRQLPLQFHTPSDEDENWSRTRDGLNRCLALSNEFSRGNLLVLLMFHRRSRMESMVSGDASLRSWKYHAQTVACLTFLGYHAEHNREPYVPTFTSELKRILCASIYGGDKTFASFAGRPPLLSKTFMTTPLPLDLREDYLFSNHSVLREKAATTLDERGWSTEGHFTAATAYRARGMLKTIREDILTIALGVEQNASVDALLNLGKRQATIMAELPRSAQHRPEDVTSSGTLSEVVFARLLIKMDALQSGFFLDRLLLKRGYDSSAHLLVTSFQLVSDTLIVWTNFERFVSMKRDFEWILMTYGAPAGGILCKELQKPSFAGRHPQDRRITRSSIIQKLSLLVGFLEWVDPLAPNAELCNDCKSVIQLVLDQALNGVGGPAGPPVPLSSAMTTESDPMGLEFLGKGLDFNFDLMDSFDWLTAEL
ncbi:uncharacterized protein B0I36DRAFT_394728 [Microdochium trichocladiopsis]|uniref:Zn(2)-C6 fungal-type domain-containing protein n=1 Tax=Microdochium trichocladiopsis TaxID=1682393 RepID=A0A9P8XTK8_9PEZI|nr:uncharacterized protein B0I36DRAFT_394728 [Microdochium trichocladiopsis]KAH7018095.1 hypothetical protein B0I36DRAFT_394728 [Microdochium trichocladiopsis]